MNTSEVNESMTQSTPVNSAVDRLRNWREQYRGNLVPSALEDISRLSAKLDLTHAHPSGIAQLFASGQAPLDALFRDMGVLIAAGTRLERVFEDQNEKRHVNGVAELSMVIGVAAWKGYTLPVLVYPVEVSHRAARSNAQPVIRFIGPVQLNPWFVAALREQGIDLDERKLFDGSNYVSGSPETSAIFAAIVKQGREKIPDFSIERQIILGCFIDPAARFLAESQQLIDALQKGPSGNVLLDGIAGYKEALQELGRANVPEFSPFDNDPHSEVEVGDVSNEVRYAAAVAGAGHSLVLDGDVGEDTAAQAAAIASRCVSRGRSVLYVPCVAEQKRRFELALARHDLESQYLDIAHEQAAAAIDRQLIDAVAYQPGSAASQFDQLSDELVGVRSRLTRYLGDLHSVNERWNVSAYQTIQQLANIAVLPTHPATRVRLGLSTARSLSGHLDTWVDKLRKAGDLGEFTIGPDDTPWYGAALLSEADAVAAYQRVTDVLRKLLPATREQVASTTQTCGFPVPSTAQEWARQVNVLKNLRRVLDVFQPEIFERDITSMIEATKPKAERKSQGTNMGFWERRRHVKEAKSLLRVGAQLQDLHEALKVVRRQAEQWHDFVPHGGWPVLPPKLDAIIDTQDALAQSATALDAVLASTPQGGNLQTLDFNALEERLKALYADYGSLDTLPGRCLFERDFSTVGLNELVEDLRARHVHVDAVAGELLLAWWTTVFEDIVRSSAIISNQDGSALQAAADRFAQVDGEHIRSIGPMVRQESMRRLCDLLFSRTQEANQLHTVLAGNGHVPISRLLHDHPQIIAAAKPVLIASPASLVALSNPVPVADVVIIDGAAHVPSIQLLSVVARARHMVVLAHRSTVTSPGLKALISMLPSVSLPQHPSCRAPQLVRFLNDHGYGDLGAAVTTDVVQGQVHFHRIDANGVPVADSGLIESSQQEIDEVIKLITKRASRFTIVPADYVLTVVTLTAAFRNRLGAELRSLAAKHESMGRFLRHVRLIGVDEANGARATDVIISLSYAKTVHGRLLQQFGVLQGEGGSQMLLEALALAQRNLDVVAGFGSDDLEDERLHQDGPKLLKATLSWLEQLSEDPVRPQEHEESDNVLFNDLAARIRARGLRAAVQYGFDAGDSIALVVGLKNKPFSLAVLTDDAAFIGIPSTRRRHRVAAQQLEELGWSVITVWSVAAFVNPDKEVDRIVEHIGAMYREGQ